MGGGLAMTDPARDLPRRLLENAAHIRLIYPSWDHSMTETAELLEAAAQSLTDRKARRATWICQKCGALYNYSDRRCINTAVVDGKLTSCNGLVEDREARRAGQERQVDMQECVVDGERRMVNVAALASPQAQDAVPHPTVPRWLSRLSPKTQDLILTGLIEGVLVLLAGACFYALYRMFA